MAGDGVVLREQHRVVAPGHPLPPHLGGESFQRFHARLDGGHPRLDVLAVGGDGVEETGGEAVGHLMQPGQDGAVVLGAEHHAVHLVRGEVVAGDQMGIAGVAHQHIPLFKAAQQPVGIILHGVGAPAGLDDRGPQPPPQKFSRRAGPAVRFLIIARRGVFSNPAGGVAFLQKGGIIKEKPRRR